MKLNEDSYRWALKHLNKESDTDLFPRPIELDIVQSQENDLIAELNKIEIGSYEWHTARRFLIPKDDLAYRNSTQLHLIDSIVLSAIIFEYGSLIEKCRLPKDIVFSYRFGPQSDGTLYPNKNAWNQFWKACQGEIADVSIVMKEEDDDAHITYELLDKYSHVVTCDISDFYNQIYLHTIENQLISCGFPLEVKNSIKKLLKNLNENNSRGVPTGPHCSHILAEMSLIPVDDSLNLQGILYKRYVDDVVFFCESEKEARVRVQQFAEVLDKEQRMVLQRQKTRIYTSKEFLELTTKMLIEQPVYETENEVLHIIRSYTDGDPYLKINLENITKEDLAKLSKESIIKLLGDYVNNKNYERLRWLYRRLSQIGIPHAIDFSIENYEIIIPALNDVCLYINSCATNYDSDWKALGETILKILDDDIIKANPFYQISLLNLFVYNKNLNHIQSLIKLSVNSNEDVLRKILLACRHYKSESWIYGLKEKQARFSEWTKRAYIVATKGLPSDQKRYLHQSIEKKLPKSDILERIIIKWAS